MDKDQIKKLCITYNILEDVMLKMLNDGRVYIQHDELEKEKRRFIPVEGDEK